MIGLAPVVYLPAKVTLTSREVISALGCSRQSLNYYRRHHNFPKVYGKTHAVHYDTAAVAAWVRENGAQINFV